MRCSAGRCATPAAVVRAVFYELGSQHRGGARVDAVLGALSATTPPCRSRAAPLGPMGLVRPSTQLGKIEGGAAYA